MVKMNEYEECKENYNDLITKVDGYTQLFKRAVHLTQLLIKV